MDSTLRAHAEQIVRSAIGAVLPDEAVIRALEGKTFPGRVILVAAGKAAWQMAKAAWSAIGPSITSGIVITKYEHVKGPIGNLLCLEAGHPVPDLNSFLATEKALEMTAELTQTDTVLFLLSGGGSALFESSLVDEAQLQDITAQLLASGADIVEMNTIRKRLSRVKGGKFALHCAPAQIYSVVLSDILGDPLDMIASGPACADSSTAEEAVAIAKKYRLRLSDRAWALLHMETPKVLTNVQTQINGSVRQLCLAAADACASLGYTPHILTDMLSCEAKDAGVYLATSLKPYIGKGENVALIAGGETVVKLTGKGKGGRNQELALSAAPLLSGISGCALFSVGSDGTDGPTDAAGGYVDHETENTLTEQGVSVAKVLQDNDAYHALQKSGGLIITGPTGTNVNDVAVCLYRAK